MGASQKLSGSEFRRAFFVEAWEMLGFCSGLGASKLCRVGTSGNCRGIRTVSARMLCSRDHESKLAGCYEKKCLDCRRAGQAPCIKQNLIAIAIIIVMCDLFLAVWKAYVLMTSSTSGS